MFPLGKNNARLISRTLLSVCRNGLPHRLIWPVLISSSQLFPVRRTIAFGFEMAKRKRSSLPEVATTSPSIVGTIAPVSGDSALAQKASSKKPATSKATRIDANPDTNTDILDGKEALRASPDAEGEKENSTEDGLIPKSIKKGNSALRTAAKLTASQQPSDSSLSELSDDLESPIKQSKGTPSAFKLAASFLDPEADADDLDADPEELSAALSRPPPVNSSHLPLPWKGRLGYACLNTYLRNASPPVFSSRTCRIASILENRHPLKDPSQPAHPTKNRPDRDQPADTERGQAFVEGLGLANARDIPKMLRWNDKYGIKFLRLSSEMFPFASHDTYGYRLAPFASEALAEAGRVAAELGHRLTTHPGQFTQLGSPRKEVITASIRDLQYHTELLSLLKLPEQFNKDAVMILHMGGIFGDKAATLDRFRKNYASLDQNIKDRIVLENDDVCYSVHDLLPICEELNIPLVLDYHHHNIIFDNDKIREGTLDIMDLYPRIKATWTRKGITQKMHYSEPTPGAITGRQRRKHNPRVATLPPCALDMDLMIEAKDKEQAVFELMRTFKLPGFDRLNALTPYSRDDENRPWKPPAKKKTPKKSTKKLEDDDVDAEEEPQPQPPPIVPEEEVGMGGPQGRVYWPPGMEEWLRPKKREIKKKDVDPNPKPTKTKMDAKKTSAEEIPNGVVKTQEDVTAASNKKTVPPAAEKAKATPAKEAAAAAVKKPTATATANTSAKKSKKARNVKVNAKSVPTPSTSDAEDEDEHNVDVQMQDLTDASDALPSRSARNASRAQVSRRQSGRGTSRRKGVVSYKEDEEI